MANLNRQVTEVSDFLAIARGKIPGIKHINKFGRAPSGLQTSVTDVWDRADASATQQIWTAPTTARVHNIVSTSSDDDGNPAGVGARTIRVFGLTSWSTSEVTEDITMNGTSNVATASSYVIIHRMFVLTKGATNVNVGVITATAQTDGTVTAQINVGEGQTQMAIYGVPSNQKVYMVKYYFSFNKAGGASSFINLNLLVNPEPDAELINFVVKHTQSAQSNGTSDPSHSFMPYFEIPGPAIIKMQGTASAVDIDASAGFDIIIIDS